MDLPDFIKNAVPAIPSDQNQRTVEQSELSLNKPEAQRDLQQEGLLQFDVAILCALHAPELEKVFRSVEAQNHTWTPVRISGIRGQYGYQSTSLTTLRQHNISIVAAYAPRMGPVDAAIMTAQTVLRFRPKLVVMAGIAAGSDRSSQGFGDILVANAAFNYSSGKKTRSTVSDGFKPDFSPVEPDVGLIQQIQEFCNKSGVLNSIRDSFNATKPRSILDVHVGPMGSADQVVDAEEVISTIKERHQRKLIGIDMETYAVYRACKDIMLPDKEKPLFVSCKSICDFATDKSDDWQSYAAFTSAEFVIRFLKDKWEDLHR